MDTVCRVCIEKLAKSTLLNTKIENSSNLSFFDFLNKCTTINACENDKLPQRLCSVCTDSIKTFYSFVKLAEKSDITLREALKNSTATGRYNDNRDMSCEEITIRNEKIEEGFEDLNKKESLHCEISKNSTGSSFFILDIVKEEPCLSESTPVVAKINESEFHTYPENPEKSIEEPNDILSSHLASSDSEHSDSEDDVAISLLKKRLVKHEDETDFLRIKIKNEDNIATEHECINQASSGANIDSLKTHLRGQTENTYKCIQCNIFFNDREEFRTHCRIHIHGDKHNCIICGKNFPTRRHLYKHLLNHEEKRKYICTLCGKSFNHSAGRWKHMKTHSGEKPFDCEICGKKFGIKERYTRHLRTHTHPYGLSNKKYECKICSKKFSSNRYFKFHMENHSGIINKCDKCNKEYKNSYALSRHLKRHNEPRSEKCKICSKEFSTTQYLKIHIESHKGITKKCEHCEKKFKTSFALARHIKWHANPKPFKCGNCGKSLSRNYTYFRHIESCKSERNSLVETFTNENSIEETQKHVNHS